MTEASPSPSASLDRANDRIRDAAKWLIASSAAVAAALIAGSQLSSIGKLQVGWPTTLDTARLWVAVIGAIVGLLAVVYVLWTAVKLLPEENLTIRDLAAEWDEPTRRTKAAIAFFTSRQKYLQGFDTPRELENHREEAVADLSRTTASAAIAEKTQYIAGLDERIRAVEARANNKALEGAFEASLRKLLWATVAAALGILAFAWAANPPDAPPATADLTNSQLNGAHLRDADLAHATLDGADLSGADLAGADLTGASTKGVIWRNTVCPDGSNSDTVGGSCAGHLAPRTR